MSQSEEHRSDQLSPGIGPKAADPSRPAAVVPRQAWSALSDSDPTTFGQAWLRVFATAAPGLLAARLMLRRPGEGLVTIAEIGTADRHAAELGSAAEAALAKSLGVARRGPAVLEAAYPVSVDGRIEALISVAAPPGVTADEVQGWLRWGAGWLRAWVLDRARASDAPSVERARAAIELLSGSLEEEGFRAAALRTVTEIARLGQCDRVSVGFRRRGRVRVAAISHTAQFGKRMDLVRLVGGAMDEALDQQATLLWPVADEALPQGARAQGALSRQAGDAQVLTIPVFTRGRFAGAFTFERTAGAPFDQPTVDLLAAATGLAGPILEEKRRNDRWLIAKTGESLWRMMAAVFGKGYLKLKLAGLVLIALAVLFSQWTTTYTVGARAVLEGRIQRAVVAPFDGFVAAAPRRAGDTVAEGELLARLDDRDLTLERLNWHAERRQAELEYETAVGERDRARLNILQARIEQAEAQIDLIEGQIARADIRAPFGGLIVSGDLSQAIGGSATRGQELFRIAPLDDYRVMLWIDEAQVGDVVSGATGSVVLSAMPTAPMPIRIGRVTPVAEVRDGRNMFRAEADLLGASDRLRPGMEGLAKVDVGERLVIWTWTRELIDWTRLTFWRLSG
ncbi:efflux RND transporter periplasmic adaptor subunit [Roseisalinus antarcticus]|uniref:HlyD family secretion protein n=1 Tax=Roseisalinus antarcticus TaxID=254357 RepID=A0A1Y5TBJ2_9RHOB|nr:HlyD family efflux transporter periplasmic adaptor subunit [Roseisalinus antarcticus]SLN56663.1 HlyD family secretion protein [Roseisalinus antarcticus]